MVKFGGYFAVESRAGAPVLGSGGLSVAFAPGLSPAPLTAFPVPRSSNRACGFPAPGFPSRSCLRPRKALGLRRKTGEAVYSPQPIIREAHILPDPNLMLPIEPPPQPLRRVRIQCRIGRTDLTKVIVARPTRQHPVQPLHHLLRRHQPISRSRPLTDLTADALDARLARTGANITPVPARSKIASNAIPKKLQRLLGTSQAPGLLLVNR